MAGSQGTSAVITFGGVDYRHRRRYVSYESVKGGFGARPVKDGINAVASTVSNMMNTPIEILEMSFPLRVEEYALVPDSGGAGKYRGGLGVRRVWRVLGDQSHAAVCCERTVTPPFGLDGGAAGGAGAHRRDPAARQRAQAEQQGRLPRAGRLAWCWRRPAPAATARRRTRPRRRFPKTCWTVTLRRPSPPRSTASRRPEPQQQGETPMSELQPVVAQKGPVQDRGGGRQILLVVRLRQERQAAVLRRLAQGQRVRADGVQGRGSRRRSRSAAASKPATSRAATARIGACSVR